MQGGNSSLVTHDLHSVQPEEEATQGDSELPESETNLQVLPLKSETSDSSTISQASLEMDALELQRFTAAAQAIQYKRDPSMFRQLLREYCDFNSLKERAYAFNVFDVRSGFNIFANRYYYQ